MTNAEEKRIDKIKAYAMSAASLLEDIDGKDFEGMLDTLDDAKDDFAQATKEIDAMLMKIRGREESEIGGTERYLSAEEGGKLIGLSPSTLRKMAWKRRIRSFKVLGCLRFRREDLERLIVERPAADTNDGTDE